MIEIKIDNNNNVNYYKLKECLDKLINDIDDITKSYTYDRTKNRK